MKTLVFAGLDASLLNFRGPLLRAIVEAGHETVGVAPEQTLGVAQKLAAIGVRFVPVPLSRAALNPLADMQSRRALARVLEKECPEVVLSYTIKPVIYGSLAAASVGVPHIFALITGLGSAFNTPGIKGRLLRFVASQMYLRALDRCEKVFVQNKEIAELFVSTRIVRAEKIILVPGSGVDTRHFAFSPLPEGPPVYLYLGRLLRDKGVGEFVAAARLVRARAAQAKFVLVGDPDPNPTSFSKADVAAWQREGVVEHFGFQADVRPFLRDSTVFVLPSYHEGLPRSVLEAMATGRPIITTDTIGCRETIFDAVPCVRSGTTVRRGRNGFLVPVRSVEPLAATMKLLAVDRPMAVAMASESRRLAENVFDVRLVNDLMLREMNLNSPVGSARRFVPHAT